MKTRQVAAVLRRMIAAGETEWPASCVWWAREHTRRRDEWSPHPDLRAIVLRHQSRYVYAKYLHDAVFHATVEHLLAQLQWAALGYLDEGPAWDVMDGVQIRETMAALMQQVADATLIPAHVLRGPTWTDE